jgi:hypothetical protein
MSDENSLRWPIVISVVVTLFIFLLGYIFLKNGVPGTGTESGGKSSPVMDQLKKNVGCTMIARIRFQCLCG